MNDLKNKLNFLSGWKSEEHKETFNIWNRMSKNYFKYTFSSFEENKYLIRYQSSKSKFSILDFGCSSGYLKRFLNFYYGKNYDYIGYDVSEESIKLAKQLYGEKFFTSENDLFLNSDLNKKKFDIVYSRDTVLHQKDPWKFIDDLILKVKKHLILRLRTRNKGETILDLNKSCQLVPGEKWVPYIVLNYNELIQYLKKYNFKLILTNRSKVVLGGKNKRFLDKALYLNETEGAETSIFASYDKGLEKKGLIETNNLEGHDYIKKNHLTTTLFKILNKLKI